MVTHSDLQSIANILRRTSLEMTTASGSGHPTSCLSSAEIMSVLFFDVMRYDSSNPFQVNNDEFILSKGHAAPILYASLYFSGCISQDLMTLREFGSVFEGHPVPSALPWVKVATGSLGQGLSVGVGMALAAKKQKRDGRVYVLLGDSEVAEGSVYEALQLAKHYSLDNLTAIVDVNRLGQRGETICGHNLAAYEKRFSGFGWQVISIDGHSVSELQKAFRDAKKKKSPTLILAKTLKGKGISFLENKDGWHGKALSSDDLGKALTEIPESSMPSLSISLPSRSSFRSSIPSSYSISSYKKGDLIATRSAYGSALARLAKQSKSIIAIDAEVSNSTYSNEVKKKTPEQFVETFIAEQNLVGVALGLSKKGYAVFGSTFAAFFSRAHDQLRMASLSNASLVFCGSHAGVSIGADGASQMGLGDISMFRNLYDSTVLSPSDATSCESLVNSSVRNSGITYIRTFRPKLPVLYSSKESFPIGKFKVLSKSNKDKVVLVGSGVTVHECLEAEKMLKEKGVSASVIDLYSIKPFDAKKFISFVKTHGGKVVVSEDHYPEGGVGEMLKSACSGSGLVISSLTVKKMPRSGTKDELLSYEGIDASHISKAALSLTS